MAKYRVFDVTITQVEGNPQKSYTATLHIGDFDTHYKLALGDRELLDTLFRGATTHVAFNEVYEEPATIEYKEVTQDPRHAGG
jgi:hypothetical protein